MAGQYADRARADSAPVTLTGSRIAVDAVDRGPDLTGTPDTVWVGTIHGAKGLEWPHVVVMLDHDPSERSQTSGGFVVPAVELDVSAPLAGRVPRYWPAPLTSQAALQKGLSASEHAARRTDREREESGRLQYVALTRAADVTVLSGDGSAPVLDMLVPAAHEDAAPPLSWTVGGDGIAVRGGGVFARRGAGPHRDSRRGRGALRCTAKCARGERSRRPATARGACRRPLPGLRRGLRGRRRDGLGAATDRAAPRHRRRSAVGARGRSDPRLSRDAARAPR
ncbi:3'-5' exonuclease [Brachybacterium sp. GPGPB12]|uniref:3'-5' exonuclease n=1 Tax=Brachybacterium sp. GPGPB12 TaxID=3023517 RepID=UPI0031344F39